MSFASPADLLPVVVLLAIMSYNVYNQIRYIHSKDHILAIPLEHIFPTLSISYVGVKVSFMSFSCL